MRAIIIDDELKAQRVLQAILTEHCNGVEVVDIVGNVPDALKSIHQNQPDVLFLDIEMPGYTGFQLLDLLPDSTYQVIFTTAHSDYALQAFEVAAVDYLLKPIRIQKLQQAVERAKKNLLNGTSSQESLVTLKTNMKSAIIQRLALPVNDGLIFVDVRSVIMVEAEGAYTRIFLDYSDQPLLISKSIKEVESALELHPDFFRPHRSYLINLQHIVKYQKSDGGTIFLKKSLQSPIAKDRKDEFQQRISNMKI
jgi:two-component system LytT family response regulator